MAYARTSPFSLTEGRLLEGEKELVYWCMSVILRYLFLFFLSVFVNFVLSPLLLLFLS